MIKIYTKSVYLKKKKGILYIDDFFDINVTTDMLSEKSKQFLNQYENATIVGNNLLNGRFGVFSLFEISTGVKTLILLQLIKERKINNIEYINLSECGGNLLNDAFSLCNNLNILVYLRNSELYEMSDFNFIVNDKFRVNEVSDLVDILLQCYGDD